MDPVNIPAKFEVRNFTSSRDNREYSKNLGSLCIRPRSIFSQIFIWLLFAWTLWIHVPNLTFVALPVPEIIGGISKIWESLDSPTLPILPNFKGLLFAWTLWICLPSLKFVALPVPEIIWGTQKAGAVPEYAHAPFSPKILKGFCSDGPCEYTCQIWSS